MLTKKQQSLSKICDDLGISNSELCKICFEQGEKEEYFKCKICPIERKKGSGYSNLLTHLEKHPPSTIKDLILQEKGAKAGPMNFHVRGLSDDAKTYHDWIEWIVMWPKARVVQSPAFEEAIVKLQKGQTLNPAEKKLVSVFKVIPKESAAEETDENLSYEDELLRDVERSKQAGATNEYRSTYHVSPTSNIVERLFSVAGIIMRPQRRQMDPWSLELLISCCALIKICGTTGPCKKLLTQGRRRTEMPQSHVRMPLLLLNASERMTKSRRKDLAVVKCKIAYALK